MTSLAISRPPESRDIDAHSAVYTVGTLRYNRRQLVVLFFWLMWNDFSITLIEQIKNLGGFLMKDHGASFTQIAILGSVGGFITPWINPWVSTWSDRHRGRYGRRRPFLFVATPLFAFFLAAIPYMPDFYHHLLRFPSLAAPLGSLPMNGDAFFIGVCGLISGLFNAVVLAIFSYLYWDVVPETVMGRFQSLSKIAALIAGLIWSFFLMGLYEHHVKVVFAGTAAFCLTIYLVSTWQIKEGEYPPPDLHEKGGILAPVRAYFVECFSQSYFLWVFVASLLFQLGNTGVFYQTNYLHYDLNLDMGTLGWAQGWSQSVTAGFGLAFGFAIGTLTDRLKGVRLLAPGYVIAALVSLASFFFVHDRWTFLVSIVLTNLINFALGIAIGAFTVEIFPWEKLGQFCSAQALFYQFILNFLNPLAAVFFDHTHNNRLGYLWTALFYFLSALAYMKVYLNWKRRHGRPPVPHAG